MNSTTVPSKRLATSITGASLTLQLNNILGWDGINLTSADFNGRLFAVLRNDANTLMEIIELDPTTIASASITILKRGLKFTGDMTTEVTANKLTWIKNETIVDIGSNPPQLYQQFVYSLNPTADASFIPTTDQHLTTKDYVDDRNGYWTGAVADFASLPIGSIEGEARVTLDDGKIYVWDVATATIATISSIDLGTNVITMTGAHGLSTGDYIYFATSGTLPAGLALNTPYYVYVDAADTLHVSLAIAGATVDITDAGTGTHTVKEASWVLAGAGGGAGTVYVTNLLGTGADDAPTNTTFTLTAGSWADQKYLQVYVNGVLQEYGATEDYTVADSNTIVFNTGVEDTDKVTLLVVSVDLYNPAWGLVNADILPDTHNTYDIGATGNRFKDGFFEGNVDIDGTLNVEGVSTFQALPTIPLTPAATTDAASKGYVDTTIASQPILPYGFSTNFDGSLTRYTAVDEGAGTIDTDGYNMIGVGVTASRSRGIRMVMAGAGTKVSPFGNGSKVAMDFIATIANNTPNPVDPNCFIVVGNLGTGITATQTNNHFGFKFVFTNAALTAVYASSADGTTQQTTSLTVPVDGDMKHFGAVFNGTNVKFYLDSTLVATHATNVPVTTAAGDLLHFRYDKGADTGGSPTMKISYFGYRRA